MGGLGEGVITVGVMVVVEGEDGGEEGEVDIISSSSTNRVDTTATSITTTAMEDHTISNSSRITATTSTTILTKKRSDSCWDTEGSEKALGSDFVSMFAR